MYYKPDKPKMMGPLEAFSKFWMQYNNAHDNAPRSEYWWNFIYVACSYLIMFAIYTKFQSTGAVIFNTLWTLLLIPPSISLTIRRFHDVNMPGSIAILLSFLSSAAQLVPIGYAILKVISKLTTSITHPILVICLLGFIILITIVVALAIYCMGGWCVSLIECILTLWTLFRHTTNTLLSSMESTIYPHISHLIIHFTTTSHTHLPVTSTLIKYSQTSIMKWATLIILICCSIAFITMLLTPSQASSYGTGHGKDIIL